jgi:hypothetical protein
MTAFQEGNRHVVDFILGMTFRQGAALSTNGRSRNFE